MTDVIGGETASGTYRTTASAVRAVGGFPTSLNVDVFIETANILVDQVAACAGSKLTDRQLEMIERWLAAHFTKVMSPSATSKSIGGASTSYEGRGNSGMGLYQTSYGQHALILDTSGCLQKITAKRPTLSWGGTSRSSSSDE